jgi:DNA replication protein DnaC
VSADAVREVEKAIMDSRWPIYLHGAQGRGKTCLAALLHRVWPARAVWFDVSHLLSQVKTCRRDGSVDVIGPDGRSFEFSEAALFDRLANAGLLVLDDLGCRTPTDVDIEILTRAINTRAGKPLIATSNLNSAELHNTFGARLASRLLAGQPLCLSGADRRLTHSSVVEVRA